MGYLKKDDVIINYSILDDVKSHRIRIKDGVDKKDNARIRIQLEDLLEAIEFDLNRKSLASLYDNVKAFYKKYYDAAIKELSGYDLDKSCEKLLNAIKEKLDL